MIILKHDVQTWINGFEVCRSVRWDNLEAYVGKNSIRRASPLTVHAGASPTPAVGGGLRCAVP
jgi:hypothetical protein